MPEQFDRLDVGRVLIVEDDDSTRSLYAAVLDAAGYATVAVGSLRNAAAVLDDTAVSVVCVVLDARLPDGDGVDLLRRVRADIGTETLPVVVITGDDGPDVEIDLLDAGATDFLVKPVSVERLVARINARMRDRASWLAALESTTDGRTTTADGEGRARIEEVISHRAFWPVFQPIVDLRDRTRVGFEALTRFDDGVRPDHRFQAAVGAGCGVALELATMTAAIDHSPALDDGTFLSLNVTPRLLAGDLDSLQALRAGLSRTVVLEITEREAIDDYEAVRRSVQRLVPPVMLSIDDAGAGFASLRHVVMLEPDHVKLDRSWVAHIDTEPVKQAMIAGLVHFASVTDCALIAEGIETTDEFDCLVDLGVDLGQGFLLGRPEPAS